MDIYLTNSLSRNKEKFDPINPPHVGMYTCGPTVYDKKHIGNFRTYTLSDLVYRVLKFNRLDVKYIMNFTDVGHLTGDNEGDSDAGEDRLVKAAKRDKITAWDVAERYTKLFIEDFDKLNLIRPDKWTKATDHIKEQIELIMKLEEKGLTYKITDGIYFDTEAYESLGYKYGELSDLDQLKEGARVEANPEKKNPRDFALWRFSPKDEKRDMEWESPWGVGFPGWHIECSAMSMEYLGETFDLHIGGDDIRSTHHPNEIAQSQGATGKQFVKYWVHGALILIDGERMSTSKGNNYKVADIVERGYDPLALRYLYFSTHYKQILNFTWESLDAASNALLKLRKQVAELKEMNQRTELSEEKHEKVEEIKANFLKAINDDLNMPQALAVVWEMFKSNIPSPDKYDLAILFDEVLGFKLNDSPEEVEIPEEIKKLMLQREAFRKVGSYEEADNVRKKIKEKGYVLEDNAGGVRLKKI